MAAPSSLTLNFESILSTTLFNWRRSLEDQIAKRNAIFFLLKKNGGWEELGTIGDRAAFPLMYELGTPDSYSGYDSLSTTPMEGLTTAFFDWVQASVPVSISGLEEKKNRGEAQITSLIQAKVKQATLGIQEWFAKTLLQGNGVNAGSIITPYVSPSNESSFIEPLAKLVALDPTTSVSVGNINQSTYSWWRNEFTDSSATTYVTFRNELRHLANNVEKYPGGPPNLHICDQLTFELYVKALEVLHQNPSYQSADIPFANVAFNGKPVTWDSFVPDVKSGTVAITKGTWWMLNTSFLGVKVDSSTNFANTPFVKPENQDAKTSHILWLGCFGTFNRRKQAVLGDIDTTIAA